MPHPYKKRNRSLSNMRSIRHDDLVRLFEHVIVKTPQGNREDTPINVKPGEIVEIPDRWGDFQLFKVLPELETGFYYS